MAWHAWLLFRLKTKHSRVLKERCLFTGGRKEAYECFSENKQFPYFAPLPSPLFSWLVMRRFFLFKHNVCHLLFPLAVKVSRSMFDMYSCSVGNMAPFVFFCWQHKELSTRYFKAPFESLYLFVGWAMKSTRYAAPSEIKFSSQHKIFQIIEASPQSLRLINKSTDNFLNDHGNWFVNQHPKPSTVTSIKSPQWP